MPQLQEREMLLQNQNSREWHKVSQAPFLPFLCGCECVYFEFLFRGLIITASRVTVKIFFPSLNRALALQRHQNCLSSRFCSGYWSESGTKSPCSEPLSFSIPQCQLSHSAVTMRPWAAGYKITPGRPQEAGRLKASLSGAHSAPAASPKLLN